MAHPLSHVFREINEYMTAMGLQERIGLEFEVPITITLDENTSFEERVRMIMDENDIRVAPGETGALMGRIVAQLSRLRKR